MKSDQFIKTKAQKKREKNAEKYKKYAGSKAQGKFLFSSV